jgi:ribosome assembly protein 4
MASLSANEASAAFASSFPAAGEDESDDSGDEQFHDDASDYASAIGPSVPPQKAGGSTLANDPRALLAAKRRATFSANPAKRLKAVEQQVARERKTAIASTFVLVQFQTMDGTDTGPQLELGTDTTQKQLEEVLNVVLENTDKTPYAFYVNAAEVMSNLHELFQQQKLSTESVLEIKFEPLSVFRVHPVTRCTHTLPGHTDAVLCVAFSPDGQNLASGGGDTVLRFWDVFSGLPKHTCRGHKHHVLSVAWSPDSRLLASADFKGKIQIWDPATGKPTSGVAIAGHRGHVTSLVWEPHHLNAACNRFASSSKDHTVKIWNATTRRMVCSISGHTDSVECVRWGGSGLIYTCSRDRTIRVWRLEGGRVPKVVRTLSGHGHRVNSIALSCDYVCRTGAFSHKDASFATREAAFEAACARYQAFRTGAGEGEGVGIAGTAAAATAAASSSSSGGGDGESSSSLVGGAGGGERLISCSDDFTMFMWDPENSKRPVLRMTGHVQAVNHIAFSPDGRYFASASFDRKVKVWDGRTGKFVATLHGHVAAVYQVCWSADSRLLVSASKDGTVKVWSLRNLKKARFTLPGHRDEIYCVDWSPNGQRVASGSKDRTLKLWQS